jgi:uncharacterized membrane protein
MRQDSIHMKQHARTLIIVFASLALAASVASLYVHYQLLADPSYTSFCDVSETVSCEAVLTSRYGSVFGVPVAVGGAVWSALVLLLAVAGMQPPRSETAARVAGYIFVLSTIGLAGVLYLGYASFFVLRQLCPLCLTMYVAVLGLFVVSGAAASGRPRFPRDWAATCGRRCRARWPPRWRSCGSWRPSRWWPSSRARKRRLTSRRNLSPHRQRPLGPTRSPSSPRGWTRSRA